MSQLPACQVCGCLSYNKVSGFYVCANCDTQSQEIQVQLFDFNINQRQEEAEEREEVASQVTQKERPLTSWEIYNITLKQIIEELISLGASSQLKVVAFQIWATYLQKANVAFFSKQIDKLPPLPLGFKSSDAKILYGISNLRKLLYKDVKYKKKKKDDDSEVDVNVDSSSTSSNAESVVTLRSLRRKQRKLAQSELSESSVNEESMISHNESLQTLGSDRNKRKKIKHKTVSFKSTTRRILKDMITAVKKTKDLKKNDMLLRKVKHAVEKRINDPKRNPGAGSDMVITFSTVISVIRIALSLLGDDIQLGDIMRWIGEGHVSYSLKNNPISSSENSDGCELDLKICNRNGFQTDIENVTKSLGFKDIPTPNLYNLADRYCQELCLPDEFVNYVHGIMNVFEPKMNYSEYDYRIFPNYECRVLAYILFAFKLLFSLDGITERKQSEFADRVNELHSTKTELPSLFSWNAWVRYIECRKAILSKYDPIVNNHAYQGRIDNKYTFLKQWNKLKRQTPLQSLPINEVLITSVTDTLKKITCDEERTLNIVFPASLTPQTACITHLQNNYPQLIEPDARTILENKFTNCSILHLLDHQWCQDIAAACDTVVKFVDGIAEVDTKSYKDEESDIPILSKSTTVPAYAPTKVRVIDDESAGRNRSVHRPQKCKNFKYTFESFEDLEPQSNSADSFKIYNPAAQYWFFHEYSRSTSNEQFKELSENNLSESFNWLLKELANMVISDVKDLYEELATIEAVMYSMFVEGDYSYQCPFTVYPLEW
ncbi:TATA box-binding protein-associated factor RNA polymerase I subunit B [Planococcus citri]|uniref:TATA box-binding protein-associated factor RNA polymerase I subunit B n=1 Tax=Planococcus citri TaxID=170843 RepID=UPI0031F8A405